LIVGRAEVVACNAALVSGGGFPVVDKVPQCKRLADWLRPRHVTSLANPVTVMTFKFSRRAIFEKGKKSFPLGDVKNIPGVYFGLRGAIFNFILFGGSQRTKKALESLKKFCSCASLNH
jgi:hypothetical protein